MKNEETRMKKGLFVIRISSLILHSGFFIGPVKFFVSVHPGMSFAG